MNHRTVDLEPPSRKRTSVQYVSFWREGLSSMASSTFHPNQKSVHSEICQRLLARYEDEERPHTAAITQVKLEEMHWEQLNILLTVQTYRCATAICLDR
ncbi:hypothetical protein NQ318_012713 [Aromia moschata]|uniref:Uncharacterized protein n=1 Tax=Aromia moschata TaxID=1265417 RepID=A0AAV8Y2F4_9CUCU|nr:hypothetical protein NQ318_012713 [Aromia moschata]